MTVFFLTLGVERISIYQESVMWELEEMWTVTHKGPNKAPYCLSPGQQRTQRASWTGLPRGSWGAGTVPKGSREPGVIGS